MDGTALWVRRVKLGILIGLRVAVGCIGSFDLVVHGVKGAGEIFVLQIRLFSESFGCSHSMPLRRYFIHFVNVVRSVVELYLHKLNN